MDTCNETVSVTKEEKEDVPMNEHVDNDLNKNLKRKHECEIDDL